MGTVWEGRAWRRSERGTLDANCHYSEGAVFVQPDAEPQALGPTIVREVSREMFWTMWEAEVLQGRWGVH